MAALASTVAGTDIAIRTVPTPRYLDSDMVAGVEKLFHFGNSGITGMSAFPVCFYTMPAELIRETTLWLFRYTGADWQAHQIVVSTQKKTINNQQYSKVNDFITEF